MEFRFIKRPIFFILIALVSLLVKSIASLHEFFVFFVLFFLSVGLDGGVLGEVSTGGSQTAVGKLLVLLGNLGNSLSLGGWSFVIVANQAGGWLSDGSSELLVAPEQSSSASDFPLVVVGVLAVLTFSWGGITDGGSRVFSQVSLKVSLLEGWDLELHDSHDSLFHLTLNLGQDILVELGFVLFDVLVEASGSSEWLSGELVTLTVGSGSEVVHGVSVLWLEQAPLSDEACLSVLWSFVLADITSMNKSCVSMLVLNILLSPCFLGSSVL